MFSTETLHSLFSQALRPLVSFLRELFSSEAARVLEKNEVPLSPDFVHGFEKFAHELLNYRFKLNRFSGTKDEIVKQLETELPRYDAWRKAATTKLGEMARRMSAEERAAHRQYVMASEANLVWREAPLVNRVVYRPSGYVGDAETMRMFYREQWEGESPWAMLAHRDPVNCACGQAVRNRKSYLKNWIHKSPDSGKILNLAAGPAEEILDYLGENPDTTKTFLALDHDIHTIRSVDLSDARVKYALANAFHFIKGHSHIAYPRLHFGAWLDPKKDLKGVQSLLAPIKYSFDTLKENSFDLIYSAGLFDYILNFDSPDKGAKKLTSFLFDKVAPGGKLVIGNFNKTVPDDLFFAMDIMSNWLLNYRDDKELKSFVQGIDPAMIEKVYVEKEPTGINSFLVVEKRS